MFARPPCFAVIRFPVTVLSALVHHRRSRITIGEYCHFPVWPNELNASESESSGETAYLNRNSFAVLPICQNEEFAITIELPHNTIVRDSDGDATETPG